MWRFAVLWQAEQERDSLSVGVVDNRISTLESVAATKNDNHAVMLGVLNNITYSRDV